MLRPVALIGSAVLGLAMLAFAPAALALDNPPPEICVLDIVQPAPVVDLTAKPVCAPAILPAIAHISPGGVDGEAAWPSCAASPVPLDLTLYRVHVDPGRCSA